MFGRVLVANRAEIALRIIRACRQCGIESVAVYSDADTDALHVCRADRAIRIGPAPVSESYLRGDAILDAARASHADAVHPGYGFLAEQADFAEAVEAAGLVWIGPSPENIRLMGDKIAARRAMASAGLPVLPGSDGPVADVQAAIEVARRVGYPVLLKAAGGGGGRGIRSVASADEMSNAFARASSEAREAFADDRLYVEKLLENVRHVEIQVIADGTGRPTGACHLGERECSIQRRHQKLFEEHPSPAVNETLRHEMGALAARAAAQIGYRGVGTMEFLLDGRGYYFMEMNTRLQVEHPVTELVTGIDLVQAQFSVAAHKCLGFVQEDVTFRGAAVEARIYAEDPARGFAPSVGRIGSLALPAGPNVRVDSALYEGLQVSPHYDSLLAKIICRGRCRADALATLRAALRETIICGVKTTVPLLLRLLNRPDFLRGQYHTGTLETILPQVMAPLPADAPSKMFAAIAAAMLCRTGEDQIASVFSAAQARRLSAWQREPWE